MIIKYFEINKKRFDENNFFLVYGENEGLKKEIIQTLKKKISWKCRKFGRRTNHF